MAVGETCQSQGAPGGGLWHAQLPAMRDLEEREVRRIRETLPVRLPRWQPRPQVRQAVARAIREAGDRLLHDFYAMLRSRVDLDGLMPHPARRHLHGLVWRWLARVTRAEQPWLDTASSDLLRRIGELCGRHRVPMDMVSVGISQFGHGLTMQLTDATLKRTDMLAAGHYIGSLTQLAQERLTRAVFRWRESEAFPRNAV